MKVLTVPAVLAAIGVGVAIPLLFGDDGDSGRPELSKAQVESRLRRDLATATPAQRPPDSVVCRRSTDSTYSCTATYLGASGGEALISSYDFTVPACAPTERP
jgi:hypothetical protein